MNEKERRHRQQMDNLQGLLLETFNNHIIFGESKITEFTGAYFANVHVKNKAKLYEFFCLIFEQDPNLIEPIEAAVIRSKLNDNGKK